MQLSPSVRNGVITVSLALFAAQTALAQDARAIIKKTNAVYTNAKTYQAIMQMDMSMGTIGSVSQITDIKMIPNQKANIASRPVGKATGQMAMAAAQMNTQMVDDGKTVYIYMPAMNQYMKRPHVNGNNGTGLSMVMPQLGDPKGDQGTYKLLPPVSINGKPAYAIAIGTAKSARASSIVVYIDKATYHLLQVKISGGGGASSQGSPLGQSMTMSMIVKSEKFNQPIPGSIFTFIPPRGATEMRGSFGGMMGGGMPSKGH